jgi:hypothetical protein
MPALPTLEVNAMFKNTITTADPKTGQPLPVPPELLNGVRRASEILESELSELAEVFDITSKWQLRHEANGEITSELELTAGQGLTSETHNWTFPRGIFATDDAIHRALQPVLMKMIHVFFGLLRVQLSRLRKQLQCDRESLATASAE